MPHDRRPHRQRLPGRPRRIPRPRLRRLPQQAHPPPHPPPAHHQARQKPRRSLLHLRAFSVILSEVEGSVPPAAVGDKKPPTNSRLLPSFPPPLSTFSGQVMGFFNKRHYNIKVDNIDAKLKSKWPISNKELVTKGQWKTFKHVESKL